MNGVYIREQNVNQSKWMLTHEERSVMISEPCRLSAESSHKVIFSRSQPSRLLENWTSEFLSHVKAMRPKFIALHLQEVGGKTYEKSMEYVQEFIKVLCESEDLGAFNKIRVFLDEDYNSAEHFTVSKFSSPSLNSKNTLFSCV